MSSLTCGICLEEYGDNDKSEKAPKVLSCGHTFCCKCILLTMNKNNNEIICSIDRLKDERTYDKIPFNRAIYDMILIQREQEKIPNKLNDNEKEKVNEKENEKYDLKLNIGLIGNVCVGKTALSKCYQNDEPVLEKDLYKPTISLEVYKKFINKNNKTIKIVIWDTAGQERYNALTSGYLKGLHGCFIVFDVTDRKSFNKLDIWIQLYKDFNQYKKIMILLGNKVDLGNRAVTKEEAINYATKNGLLYFETSVKTMENVIEAFNAMVEQILNSREESSYKKNEIKSIFLMRRAIENRIRLVEKKYESLFCC